jgi:hypothetical protein
MTEEEPPKPRRNITFIEEEPQNKPAVILQRSQTCSSSVSAVERRYEHKEEASAHLHTLFHALRAELLLKTPMGQDLGKTHQELIELSVRRLQRNEWFPLRPESPTPKLPSSSIVYTFVDKMVFQYKNSPEMLAQSLLEPPPDVLEVFSHVTALLTSDDEFRRVQRAYLICVCSEQRDQDVDVIGEHFLYLVHHLVSHRLLDFLYTTGAR